MTFPGTIYAPPGVYTETNFDEPLVGTFASLRIPIFIGTGSEILSRSNVELVRGSSSSVDQEIFEEDATGRAVVSIDGSIVTLGSFNGEISRFQVRNFPIVTGDGNGTTTSDPAHLQVTVNSNPVVVLGVNGTTGVVEISATPQSTDEVRISYFFNREDSSLTEDLSRQVTVEGALIRGALGETFTVVAGQNDTLALTVDREAEASILIPAGTWTAAQISIFVNSANIGSLAAQGFENSEGNQAVQLLADESLSLGSGSANTLLGFAAGDSTSRNRVFFTYQGPIVDGSNGGITSTNPQDVVVTVDGVGVIATAVDGASRSVTLGFPPAVGSVIQVTYFFNTWQDTFDFLPNRGILDVTQAGITPDRLDFLEGTDFILKEDRILWGTAALVSAGTTTDGSVAFGDSQISATLIDHKTYLESCASVTNTRVNPPVTSRTEFKLPFVPTTGNGRNSPLGSSLFQTVSNDRIDLPTNRPDLVTAYWGFGVQDALDRGPVAVTKVESVTSTITLAASVPVGAAVFATFYYNVLEDDTYSLTVVNPGASGVGSYAVTDSDGLSLFAPVFGTKSTGLTGIQVQFPSGSELLPDSRFEGGAGVSGAVGEVITVTFGDRDETPAKYTTQGFGDYLPISGASDHARIKVDGADASGAALAAGVDLSGPLLSGLGFFASLVGEEIVYDPSTSATYGITALNNEVSLQVDGVLVTGTAVVATADLGNYVNAINAAAALAPAEYISATKFTSPVTITASEYDILTFHYNGSSVGVSGNLVATLAPGTYGSATLLAAAVQSAITTAIGAGTQVITVTANADGRLVFALTKAPADSGGYLDFITHATQASDFAILAGIDTAAATGGVQTKLADADIARRYTVTGTSGALSHDRLILRNRLMPGEGSMASFHQVAQAQLLVLGTTPEFTGISSQDTGLAGRKATVLPATQLGIVGFSGGQGTGFVDERDSQPIVTFYDGTGTEAANNVFKFTVDGVPVTVVFPDSNTGAGTAWALGPAGTAPTILNQIADAMSTAGFGASAAAVVSAGLVLQEGAGIRLVSSLSSTSSSISIGNGASNGLLGFTEGSVTVRTGVAPKVLASALMQNDQATVPVSIFDATWASPAATYFAGEALASTVTDAAGSEFLYLQSLTLGVGSSIAWDTATVDDVLLPGTLLLDRAGDGNVGEAGISGFTVTSSDPVDGSGTGNTSILGGGAGQDGVVGQTYHDAITGLVFTVLPREGGTNYPTGESFTLVVSDLQVSDANTPIRVVGGVSLTVANTSGSSTGDTGLVETFERGGAEPSVGDTYFVSYDYTKTDFRTRLFTELSAVERNYGRRGPENPVSLAAALAFQNGAILLGIKQTPKLPNSAVASIDEFFAAVDDLRQPLPGGVNADILIPLHNLNGTAVTEFFQYLTAHVDLMSSIRYRAERTAISGLAAGTVPSQAKDIARSIGRTRFRLVYPDVAIMSLTDAFNNTQQTVVNGTFVAAALAGSLVNPKDDVATPWTNKNLFGFDQLGRTLNFLEKNEVAVAGITLAEDVAPNVKIRDGLTTDLSNVLTRNPTIIQIADEVQKQARQVLAKFSGIKFLPGVLSQIEGRLGKMFQNLVAAQVITAFTGVKANISPTDPTIVEVTAAYSPVFPLKYIVVTLSVRSSLGA